MKKAFITYFFGDDNVIENFGTFKMINSFYYHHHDIPLYIMTTKDVYREAEKITPISNAYFNPVMTRTIADEYDLVVHIDTDVVVTDRLDEILEGDYEVAVARNNSDQESAGCGTPHCLNGEVSIWNYANAGIVAATKKEFWDDWIELNKQNFNKYKCKYW